MERESSRLPPDRASARRSPPHASHDPRRDPSLGLHDAVGNKAISGFVHSHPFAHHAEGHPLDAATRAFFEPRFGRNFGDVRVHPDDRADETARALHAVAYTYGTDIAFRTGRYHPASRAGLKLIAHELTHVAQQRGGAGTDDDVSRSTDACEVEARRVA